MAASRARMTQAQKNMGQLSSGTDAAGEAGASLQRKPEAGLAQGSEICRGEIRDLAARKDDDGAAAAVRRLGQLSAS